MAKSTFSPHGNPIIEQPYRHRHRHLAHRVRRHYGPERHREEIILLVGGSDRRAADGHPHAVMRTSPLGAHSRSSLHVQALDRGQMGQTAPWCRSASPSARSVISRALASARLPAILTVVIAALLSATCTTREAEPIDVSVRDVAIDPYAVDGKLVRLFGFLHHTREGDALYWLGADTRRSIESQPVAVHFSSTAPAAHQEPDGSYIVLEGIFHATKPQRRGWSSETAAAGERFNGALVDARRVQTR